jgi:Glycosyltransferase family 9 (heptosyltransferase)
VAGALSNPILPTQETDTLVASEPAGQQRYAQAAMFRPPLNDQAQARRIGGRLLVLTRKALNAIAADRYGAAARTRIAATFVHEARGLLNLLRALDINRDPGFGLIATRVCERLTHIRALIPVMHDTLAVLRLIEAELLVLSGDLAAAHAGFESLMLSIRSIQGRDLRDEVAARYFDLCISRMESRVGFSAFLEYLARRLPRGRISARFGRELRLISAHADILRDAGLRQSALAFLAWRKIAQALPRRFTVPLADAVMQRVGLPLVRRELKVAAQLAKSARAVRAMGGLGDLLMMTPGLRALARRIGRPVEFAVPRRYLALFECNPFVAAHGLEDLPADWYRGGPIIDLTDCPASIIESRSAPKVLVNRIEIFARALGVTRQELRQHGLQPVFEPSPTGRQRAEQWLRSHHLQRGRFLAIQAAAAENYRTWNGMTEAAGELAELMPVVVLDGKPLPGIAQLPLSHGQIKVAIGLDLATGLALACEARLIVAPDSAFLHLAGARGIPCVGVFGPTDGALRMSAYPQAVVVSRAADLPCVPCWRNQATYCMLTGGMSSQCLESLPADAVVDTVVQLLRNAECHAPVP